MFGLLMVGTKGNASFATRCAGLAVCVLILFPLAPTARGTLFWQADTNRGTSVFETLNLAPGTITVAPDPLGQYGNVYKFYLPDTNSAFGKERCESSGTQNPGGYFRMSYNTGYYIGWRAMWNPMPINGSWVALFQMHGYGVAGQGAPLVLRCVNGDGKLYMQNGANGVDTNFWHTTFRTNVWQSFVLHVFLSTNAAVAYTEIWYNGVLQTNNAGTTRWYGPTWDDVDGVWSDSYNKVKWGVYRSGSLDGQGDAIAYMSGAKIGSAYTDVDPNGGGDFSITTTPSSQFVPPGGGTNYTVMVGALGGFSTNVTLSASGLPVGASANFSPATVTNFGSSTLAIVASPSTPVDSYPISVAGTSGTLAHSNTVTLVVSGFTLSTTPSSQAVYAGGSTNFTVTVATNESFSGNVALGVSGLPVGASANFSPPTLMQSGASTLTINTASNSAFGNYPLTISGTNGSLVLNTPVTLSLYGPVANPGPLLWTAGGVDTNWSTSLNWMNPLAGGNGPPGAANGVVFTNSGVMTASALTSPGSGVVLPARISSSVNGSFVVAGLTNFANAINTSPAYHNLGIASGATLSTSGIQIGGFAQYDFGANNVVSTTISGAGATLVVTGGGVVVSQGSGSSGAHNATLDLSGLDNLAMTGTQIKAGVENITRAGGVIYLAKTNTLTLLNSGYSNADGSGSPYSGNPGFYLGHNKSAVGNGAQIYLGISNAIAVDYVTVGRGDVNDLLEFNPAFINQNPSVYISGTNGSSSPVAVYVVADNSPGEGSSGSATNDFTGGTVSALINYLCVARGREGASDTTTSSGYLTFNNGSISANVLAIGFLYPNGSNSFANGTVNVNGNARLTVMTNIMLASQPAAGGGAAQGTLNINGGLVETTNITGGGGASAVNLYSGTMDLEPNWAIGQGVISNITSLHVGGNGNTSAALLTDAALVAAMSAITVESNGVLAGNTIINTPALAVNGTISPGSGGAGGITNSGSLTFGPGGHYEVTVNDATSGPVVGWSFLHSGGGINIQSTPTNPFTIDVGTAGNPADDFNSRSNYDWVIATSSSIANFAMNDFVINSSQFQNDLGAGTFFLHTNADALVLSFTNNLSLATRLVVSNFAAVANGFVFSGGNGLPGGTFHLLSSTNLELPFTNWSVIITNSFDNNGNFIFTNPRSLAVPRQFYLLKED